jgi:hypothetical protein
VGRNIKELCGLIKSLHENAIKSRAPFVGALVVTHYEDLVKRPKTVFSSIAQQLGLEVSGQVLLNACEAAVSFGGAGTERNGEDGTFWSELYEKPVSSERSGAHEKVSTEMERQEITEIC